MAGFEEGKLSLRSTANNNRRRFFDQLPEEKKGPEEANEEVEVKVSQEIKKKKRKKEPQLENVLEKEELNKAAREILIDALKDGFKKRVEDLKIKNVKGEELLDDQVRAVAMLVGKDIIADEFIMEEIKKALEEKSETLLQETYKKKIEAVFNNLSASEINELLFDLYINNKIESEIKNFKKAASEGAIYQGKVKELDDKTVEDLKEKILAELDKTSLVKQDFLAARERNQELAIMKDYEGEISTLIHQTIREQMIIDEIPVTLNISKNKMENEKEEIAAALLKTIAPANEAVEMPVSGQEEKIEIAVGGEGAEDKKAKIKEKDGEQEKNTSVENGSAGKDTSMVEKEDAERKKRIKELVESCNEKGRLLRKKYAELKSHVVTDEELIDVIHFNNGKIVPMAKKIRELLAKVNNLSEYTDQIVEEIDESQADLDSILQATEEMITKHQVSTEENEVAEREVAESKVELENFETAVELAREFKDKFLKKVEGKEFWEQRGEYQEASLRLETTIFLSALIDQEKIVEESDKDAFIEYVLSDVFSAEKAKGSDIEEDSFNKMLKNVKI